jgi:UDPglucose 6-dehydrogenase/GDP-mannose 6-dehydrogenase
VKVSIVGTGYVGLVSGVCLAEKGHEVICVDVDQAKVDRINKGDTPIYESGLPDLLRRNLGKNFRATTNLRQAVLDTTLTMIAVGTPFDGNDINLEFIRRAASQIGSALRAKDAYHVVVVKSTVVPGTTDDVVTPLIEQGSGKKVAIDFGVGMNPEFLREGEAVQDFLFPDRIVLGGIDQRTMDVLEELYEPFIEVEKLRTNPRTAETIKYTANALLATMISFSNEIGNLCSSMSDVDVVDVMRGVHLDKRLSPILEDGRRIKPTFTTYLEAGCGFGGSCFPKDVRALISYGKKTGNSMQILDAVMNVNAAQPLKVIASLQRHFPSLNSVRVAVLGLAFKPGTDDVRESPSISIIRELLTQQALVSVFDPAAQSQTRRIFSNESVNFAENLAEAIYGAEAILLLTRWPEFEAVPNLISTLREPPILIDGRRMLNKHSVARYEGIGLRNARKTYRA